MEVAAAQHLRKCIRVSCETPGWAFCRVSTCSLTSAPPLPAGTWAGRWAPQRRGYKEAVDGASWEELAAGDVALEASGVKVREGNPLIVLQEDCLCGKALLGQERAAEAALCGPRAVKEPCLFGRGH